MTSQNVSPTPSTQSDKAALFHADVALDVTPHSTLVVENLHYYLEPGKCACNFLYVLPEIHAPEKTFTPMDEETEQETLRVVNAQFDKYAHTLSSHHLVAEDRHFIRHAETIEDGILDHIEKQIPDLLVLGMHEPASRHKGWRITSTSYAAATHAPCSVLVIKNPTSRRTDKLNVLFATDGSAHALKAAMQLNRFLPKETSAITILNVVSVNYYLLPTAEPYINYIPLTHALQGEAIQLLEKTKKQFEQAGFTVANAFFNVGDPGDHILQEAEKNDIDLIVLGAHGASERLTKWLLGSVSSKVLEYSEASIAILR